MAKVKKVAEADGTPVKDAEEVVGAPEEFGLTNEDVVKLAEEKAAADRIEAKKNAAAKPQRHPSNLGVVPEVRTAPVEPAPEHEPAVINPEIPEHIRAQFEGRQVSLLEANLQAREADRANYDYVENLAQQAKDAIIASGGRVERRARKNLRPAPIPTDERPKTE